MKEAITILAERHQDTMDKSKTLLAIQEHAELTLELMAEFAEWCSKKGYVLYTDGAQGGGWYSNLTPPCVTTTQLIQLFLNDSLTDKTV